MVDVKFKSRAKHFVPLSVLKGIAAGDVPGCLTSEDVDAIKGYIRLRSQAYGSPLIYSHSGMALLNRGRLSVQRVEEAAWNAIQTMAEKGGWREEPTKKAKGRKKQAPEDAEDRTEPSSKEPVKPKDNPRKRKTKQAEGEEDSVPVRRSTRARTKE